MAMTWAEVEGFLVEEAERDLGDGGPVRPCMLAFRGDEPVFCAFLRPLREDEPDWQRPVFEIAVLAAGMSADRVAASFSGRATSSADPIAPVTDGADLRQEVVVVQLVDGHRKRARSSSVVRAYHRGPGGHIAWGERLEMGEDEGWVAQLIVTAVALRHRFDASREDVQEQAALCALRGHVIAFDPRSIERFHLEELASLG